MTIRSAGLALAMMIATCPAGPVQAAPFSVTVGGATGADGSVSFTLTGDTLGTIGTFQFGEDEQAPDFLNWLRTDLVGPNATFAISNRSEAPDGFGLLFRSADFLVSNPKFGFTVTSTDGTSQILTGYSFAFSVGFNVDPSTDLVYGSMASANTLLIPPPNLLAYGEASVTGRLFASTVPLPGALPMAAGGLALVGALGWAGRRRTTLIQGGEG